MKKTTLFFAIILLFVFSLSAYAAAEADLQKLNGKWGVDIESSMANDEDFAAMSAEEKEFTMQLLGDLFSRFSMEFNTDKKTLTTQTPEETFVDAFTVKSTDGAKIVLETDGEELVLIFKSDNVIEWDLDDGDILTLKRR